MQSHSAITHKRVCPWASRRPISMFLKSIFIRWRLTERELNALFHPHTVPHIHTRSEQPVCYCWAAKRWREETWLSFPGLRLTCMLCLDFSHTKSTHTFLTCSETSNNANTNKGWEQALCDCLFSPLTLWIKQSLLGILTPSYTYVVTWQLK